ncbi:TatD family hydrolase [Bacillus piscicola]|uniref:TatD family hydrolase n=1 Tax=Bacillus piscicola TaxID=1632684 RepID=UPI001F099FFC|nr:TatD family hydrolase [Bacillus piscicola]
MIDAHLHLDQYDNIDFLVETWQQGGVQKVAAAASDLASSYRILELKERFPAFILAGVGFHPEREIPKRKEIEEWKRLVQAERHSISFVGEIGLPHYELAALPDTLDDYAEVLTEYLETAGNHDLPVALHAVHDKATIVYNLLQRSFPAVRAHFHWLKAPSPIAQEMIDAGYYVSVTPEVCYRKRDQQLAAMIPDTQLLIETDGPWPFQGPFAGKKTTPLLLPDIISFLATQRKTSYRYVREQTQANTLSLYV